MNPLTNMKNVKKYSEQELKTNYKTSWHDQYKDSAWIFVGGLPYDLTEGDIICVFSQYGEIVNINLIRDKGTGKSRGFCFICYEDQRSTVLSVDNLNGIKILNRIIRVDHVADYKVPKDHKNIDSETRKIHNEGCAPSVEGHDKQPLPKEPPPRTIEPSKIELDDIKSLDDIKLPERLPIGIKTEVKEEPGTPERVKVKKVKKSKKEKKSKRKKDKKKRRRSSSSESSSSDSLSDESDNEKIKRRRNDDDKLPDEKSKERDQRKRKYDDNLPDERGKERDERKRKYEDNLPDERSRERNERRRRDEDNFFDDKSREKDKVNKKDDDELITTKDKRKKLLKKIFK